jgi:hypothetical protein
VNDTELDEMLDKWQAPPVPASLRENVRAGFSATLQQKPLRDRRTRWITKWLLGARKGMFVGAALSAGLLLLIVTQALPQTPPPVNIPYTVDSEFVRYADDGSPSVEMYLTSYTNQNGAEALVSRSLPNHPFGTALGRTLDATLPAWQRLILPLTITSAELEKIKKSRPPSIGFITGCADWTCLLLNRYFFRKAATGGGNECVEGNMVGSERILNYPTTAVELREWDRSKTTLWMAPDLGCFALRITSEAQRPDGSFQLVKAKQALKVTLNP